MDESDSGGDERVAAQASEVDRVVTEVADVSATIEEVAASADQVLRAGTVDGTPQARVVESAGTANTPARRDNEVPLVNR